MAVAAEVISARPVPVSSIRTRAPEAGEQPKRTATTKPRLTMQPNEGAGAKAPALKFVVVGAILCPFLSLALLLVVGILGRRNPLLGLLVENSPDRLGIEANLVGCISILSRGGAEKDPLVLEPANSAASTNPRFVCP
jgi:hypothetical protein